MLKRLFLAAMLLLAACQSAAAPPVTPTPIPTITPLPPTETPTPRWIETQMNGVNLGMWRPIGWEADLTHGLVIAEQSVSTNGTGADGLLIYCFVPPINEFYIGASDANYAWTVLDQVVKMPSHTGTDVAISQPVGFTWDQNPAAYYLLTSGDGMRVLVIALVVPSTQKVVVCNLSAQAAEANHIRAKIVTVLGGLTVNGTVFDGKSLDNLPDPLPFPHYSPTSIPVDNRRLPASPP